MSKYTVSFVRERTFYDHAEVVMEAPTNTEAFIKAHYILLEADSLDWSVGDEEHSEDTINECIKISD